MSFQEAFSSEVFRTYVLVIIGILVSAGVTLVLIGGLLGKNVSSIWRTYRSWLVMVPLVLGFIAAGRSAVIIGVGILALSGFREFARATGLYRDWYITGSVFGAIVAVTAVTMASDPKTGYPGWYGLFMALPVYLVGILLVIPVVRNRASGQLQSVALGVLGFVYFGWMFAHLGFLANSKHALGYLLFLIFAVEVNDVAAFTCGKIFGRHPLRSEISPNKTVEGSLGAVLVSLALPWLLRFSFPDFSPMELILVGLIVGVGGQLGDLAISFIKRDIGIKDVGAVIPGHGGVLDRIDSLIFTAPLFFHMVRWFHGPG